MSEETPDSFNEELWYAIFAEGHPLLIDKQATFRAQGKPPRCKLCLAPFGGTANIQGVPAPSNRNPRYCSQCDEFIRQNPGGAKVRLTMVFTDVRDSTRLAEELELRKYVQLINKFYATTTSAIVDTDGFLMDVIGDEVFAIYPTGFSGVTGGATTLAAREGVAAEKALQAVRRLISVSRGGLPDALEFGTSMHTAEVYIGTVRGAEEGLFDVRVWGPEVNRASRLCSLARPGEVLITESACEAAGVSIGGLEERACELGGFAKPTAVRVMRG